jgi:hypothetical protein
MIDLLALPWHVVSTRGEVEALLATPRRALPLVVSTPPGLVAATGPGWLPALLVGVPPNTLIALADCGDAVGYALASLTLGVGVVAPEAAAPARPRLAAIGAELGLPVLFTRSTVDAEPLRDGARERRIPPPHSLS